MSNWSKKEVWTRRSGSFFVSVEHWQGDADGRRGPNRWGVYAYVYPEHPLFTRFALRPIASRPDIYSIREKCLVDAPLHCGCTLFRPHHKADGTVTSVQFGADYSHIDDDRFSHCSEFGGEVERDADALFAWMIEAAREGT